MARAIEWPCSMVSTSMFVSPNSCRLSHTGTWCPITLAMWNAGRMARPVSPNGMQDRAWWWMTAITSGRAMNTAPCSARSRYIGRPACSTGVPSSSNSMMSSRTTISGERLRLRK